MTNLTTKYDPSYDRIPSSSPFLLLWLLSLSLFWNASNHYFAPPSSSVLVSPVLVVGVSAENSLYQPNSSFCIGFVKSEKVWMKDESIFEILEDPTLLGTRARRYILEITT